MKSSKFLKFNTGQIWVLKTLHASRELYAKLPVTPTGENEKDKSQARKNAGSPCGV
jgi:hypothetical protein